MVRLKAAVFLLGITAFLPFIVCRVIPRLGPLSGIGYLLNCLIGGLAWLTLFVYLYHRLTPSDAAKLTRMLPLLIFALSFPADMIVLAFSWGRGGSGGEMP